MAQKLAAAREALAAAQDEQEKEEGHQHQEEEEEEEARFKDVREFARLARLERGDNLCT